MKEKYHHPFGLLAVPAVDPNCHLIVTIPAKDEAAYITDTLGALRNQVNEKGQALDPRSYEVIILANNCGDDTANVIQNYAQDHPGFRLHVAERYLPPARACVGVARRLLMDTAHQRFCEIDRPHGVICTTDADTIVDPTWVFCTLRAIKAGAKAVGGRIIVPHANGQRGSAYRKQHLLDVSYRSLRFCLESMIDPEVKDPWPRHFQNFGPSTAVRADAYAACGGMPPLRSLEDVNLALALERIDVTIKHDPSVRVTTSPRVSHRVGGRCFSDQLNEWAELTARHDTQRVVGFENCKRLFKWKVALRRAFRDRHAGACPRLRGLADRLGWHPAHLEYRVATSRSFGSLYQPIRQRLESDLDFAGEPITKAIQDLRCFSRGFRHRSVGTHRVGTGQSAVA